MTPRAFCFFFWRVWFFKTYLRLKRFQRTTLLGSFRARDHNASACCGWFSCSGWVNFFVVSNRATPTTFLSHRRCHVVSTSTFKMDRFLSFQTCIQNGWNDNFMTWHFGRQMNAQQSPAGIDFLFCFALFCTRSNLKRKSLKDMKQRRQQFSWQRHNCRMMQNAFGAPGHYGDCAVLSKSRTKQRARNEMVSILYPISWYGRPGRPA